MKDEIQCIHQLFEEQARRTPKRLAIVCGAEALTYAHLNARANQLAHHLRGLGLESGALVGLCLSRSAQVAVAILGILKAGGAWVPIDPRYPAERQSLVFKDARVSFLLTEESTRRTVPVDSAQTVLLDREWSSISKCSTSNPRNSTSSTSLAYIMYTSGSTGRPKGVMIAHANLCHYVRAMRQALLVGDSDVYLHTASFAFSSSVRQLMVPLTTGARVVVANAEQIQQPLSLFATVRDQKVTILDVVPSYWRTSIDALANADGDARKNLLANHLRLILTASEPLSPDLPKRWRFDLGHPAQMINMFGQTETTGIVTIYKITDPGDTDCNTVPIGFPIPDTKIYLLDDHHNQVPVGTVGEIYVGGPGLGSGYLNELELTAQRFITSPFTTGVVECLYKTGDLARYRADGSLEFVGRVDHQVKVRGIRVELQEIEAALNAHPAVKETVVIAREDEPGAGRRVVAYIVPKGRAVSIESVRTFLATRLPEYMIPAAFVTMDSIPRLPNGKLDRRALPAPARTRPEFEQACVPPRNPAEWKLKRIWEAVLLVAGIGVMDNFFDLGGNSLAALYMLAQVEKVFGRKLPATMVFQTPTIEEMAKVLDDDAALSWSALVPLQTEGSKLPFFWIHGDLSDAFLPRYLGTDQPVYSLVHQSQDGSPAELRTVEDIAGRYLQEIRTIQPNGPYFLGGFCFGGLVAFEVAHQLRNQGEEISFLAMVEPPELRTADSSPVPSLPPVTPTSWPGELRGDAARHLHKLRELGGRDRLTYIWLRARGRVYQSLSRITSPPTKAAKRAICVMYHRLGRPLPYGLRSFYILGIYGRATEKYVVRTYAGSVNLFLHPKAPGEDSPSCWAGLATGKIEIRRVPDGHQHILKEPFLQVWVEELRACLEKAQETSLHQETHE